MVNKKISPRHTRGGADVRGWVGVMVRVCCWGPTEWLWLMVCSGTLWQQTSPKMVRIWNRVISISSCAQFRGDSRSDTQIQIGVQPRPSKAKYWPNPGGFRKFDLPQMGWFTYHLVRNFEEIPDLVPKFKLLFSLGCKRQNPNEIPAVLANLTFSK